MEQKKKIVLLAIIGALVVLGIVTYSLLSYFGIIGTSSAGWTPREITQNNVAQILSQTNIMQDIPEAGIIAAYIGDAGYTLRKGSMSAGAPSNPDVTLRIPESYLEIMGQYGPCAAFAQARQDGVLGIEMHSESSSLAWKYRGLAKYKSCLG